MKEQWPCNLLGCYLSKYLEVPRAPLKVFEMLNKSVMFKMGKFSDEENEIIEGHMKSTGGKYDLNILSAQLKRPKQAASKL